MDDKKYKYWDLTIKILGFLTTSITIFIGVSQFNKQQSIATEMELNKNFLQFQNQLYSEICENAGALAANANDEKAFNKEKIKFQTYYYGELVLVEDSKVDSNMREIKSYLDIFKATDPKMVIKLNRKIVSLANACRESSITFKRANLYN